MINALRRIPIGIWLAVFAVLLPAASWAEIPQEAVTLGRDTELIAARTLAFASTDNPPAVEKGNKPTFHPKKDFKRERGIWA